MACDLEALVLVAAHRSPWLPGMAGHLASREWLALAADLGLDPLSYSTACILARSASAPTDIATEIGLPPAFGKIAPIRLETSALGEAYDDIGLSLAHFANCDELSAITARLDQAFRVVAQVPSLATAVGAVVTSLHVLTPPSPDHDVGYSDPAVPFSAFVGVPAADGPVAALRLAEGLVHEAMHLQLTLLEKVAPIVTGEAERHWSPWQATMRPVRGIFHGFYVFRVLDAFFQALEEAAFGQASTGRHLERRRTDISAETMEAAVTLGLSRELTPFGRRLFETLLAK